MDAQTVATTRPCEDKARLRDADLMSANQTTSSDAASLVREPTERTNSPCPPNDSLMELDIQEAYYLQRMFASLEMARNAASSAARLIHLELAGRYSLAAANLGVGDLRSWPAVAGPVATSFLNDDNHALLVRHDRRPSQHRSLGVLRT